MSNRNGEPRIWPWILLILAVVIVVPMAVWGFNVATSDIRGRGNVIQKTNEADNRIFAQEDFEKRYQDIQATEGKIKAAESAVKSDPANKDLKTRLEGLESYCFSVVGEYNAKANMVTQAKFRSEGLPYEVNNSICEGGR